ncbi:hypothetical protein PJM53_29310, partial [Mycobacterium kansasii]
RHGRRCGDECGAANEADAVGGGHGVFPSVGVGVLKTPSRLRAVESVRWSAHESPESRVH